MLWVVIGIASLRLFQLKLQPGHITFVEIDHEIISIAWISEEELIFLPPGGKRGSL